ALTLTIGLWAHRSDLRTPLLLCAGLMVATGLAMPSFQQFIPLALVAFIGTMNPSTGDIGVHVPLEHAALAHAARDEDRTHIFARYSLIGACSVAAGSLAAALPDFLSKGGFGKAGALQAMFYLYAGLGIVSSMLYARLPPAHTRETRVQRSALGPSRGVVYRLAALFSLDAFAGGFAVQSLVALWLFERFALSLSAASVFFFWSSVFAAFSFPVAAWLAGRIGLVDTMVFTHIPSSLCLIAALLAPAAEAALGLLLLRAALSQMDVPTRTSYVMAVVTPAERTAAASVTAVP